ncbi:MAG: helix-turn-helix domain-containing protein [Planctomycetes bacterium]|nr:helix-turn-helix domain-containing protein [Planctomycetota bacterium]
MILPKSNRRKLTPPQLAVRYGCKPAKIIGWIVRGELRAFNAAADRGGKPRFLIDESDIEAFETARAVTPPAPPTTRRRKLATKEYF